MKSAARQAVIEALAVAEGEVEFAALATQFAVSEMTIRRDVDVLEGKGILRRVAGGAIAFRGKAYEPPYAARALNALAGKRHIADAVAALLRPSETVILDSGSSALAVARALRGRGLGLTVVTPSLLAALELVDEAETTVIMTGGKVRAGELSLIGTEASTNLSRYSCDTFVMGVAGLDETRGASEYHLDEGAMKRTAILSAQRVIVPLDASKLGKVFLIQVANLSDLAIIVTDGSPGNPVLQAAERAGVDVRYVTVP